MTDRCKYNVFFRKYGLFGGNFIKSTCEKRKSFIPFAGGIIGGVVLFPMSRFLAVGILPFDGYIGFAVPSVLHTLPILLFGFILCRYENRSLQSRLSCLAAWAFPFGEYTLLVKPRIMRYSPCNGCLLPFL